MVLFFYVKNGKGLLGVKYGNYQKKAMLALAYEEIPLVRFYGDEYFCPTCEKLISAGYGIDMKENNIISKTQETLNANFVSLKQSLNELKPILGLLETGYYALVDIELSPSNGNGEFFWKTTNVPTYNKASCPIYSGDGNWSDSRPYYILPTQSPSKFNRERADYYRQDHNYRALAYYLDGYLCALLDGHHKAVAAAIENRPLKSLVILPANSAWETDVSRSVKGGISINGITVLEEELITPIKDVFKHWKTNKLSDEKTKYGLSLINESFDHFNWSEDIISSEKNFFDAKTLASIEWAGDLSDKRLDNILDKGETVNEIDALNIINALFYLKSIRFKQLAFYFGKNEDFIYIWYEIFSLLVKIKDEDVENYFVEYLINYGNQKPEIKKIVDSYFKS